METESGNRMKDIHEDFSRGPVKMEDLLTKAMKSNLSDKSREIMKHYDTYCINCPNKGKCVDMFYNFLRDLNQSHYISSEELLNSVSRTFNSNLPKLSLDSAKEADIKIAYTLLRNFR